MAKMGWKTIVGALMAALGYLSTPDQLALMPSKLAGVITAVGGVLAAVGLRHAIAKQATGPGT